MRAMRWAPRKGLLGISCRRLERDGCMAAWVEGVCFRLRVCVLFGLGTLLSLLSFVYLAYGYYS